MVDTNSLSNYKKPNWIIRWIPITSIVIFLAKNFWLTIHNKNIYVYLGEYSEL